MDLGPAVVATSKSTEPRCRAATGLILKTGKTSRDVCEQGTADGVEPCLLDAGARRLIKNVGHRGDQSLDRASLAGIVPRDTTATITGAVLDVAHAELDITEGR